MKKFIYLFICISSFASGCSSTAQVYDNGGYANENYSNTEINYQTFYDQLQPYGNWIDYPEYGYVWQPNAGANFRPYESNGHWASTTDGWAWASDYNWGWAPFHYGRWLLDPSVGWMWVPGYQWAPAWVTWGEYDNNYAWAPLAPGINIGIGNSWRPDYNYWSFVPRNYIQSPNLNRYVTRNTYNNTVVNNITIINNYNSYDQKDYYHRGPDYHEAERFTHKSITPLPIAATARPGMTSVTGRQFQVYRPLIARSNSDTRTAAPTVVRNINDIRGNDTRRNNDGRFNNGGTNAPNQVTSYNNDNNSIRNVPANVSRDGIINRPGNGMNDGGVNRPYNGQTTNPNNQINPAINENRRFSSDGNINNQRRNQQQPVPPTLNQPVIPVNPNIKQQQGAGNAPQNFPQRQVIRNNPPSANPQPNASQPVNQNNRNLQRVENWRQLNNPAMRQPQQQNPAVLPTRPQMPQRTMPVQRPERAPQVSRPVPNEPVKP